MSFVVVQFLTGLSNAAALFLVASGLSIIFGVTRVVNFAHGSFYMIGAYLALQLVTSFGSTALGFWGAVVLAALGVGLVGVVVELLVLRRVYRAPELFQLVATFGVVLIVQDLALWIWGPDEQLGPRAPGLSGAVKIGEHYLPSYDLFLLATGPLLLLALWLLFHRTRWGILVRAATADRTMTAALGVNQSRIFTSVFFLGALLAGLGGALQVPRQSVSLLMDLNIIAEAFVVVVVGGMGSLPGAFVAAVLIAELNAFGILLFPRITLVLMFLVMMVVLVLRPWGLLGRPEIAGAHGGDRAPRPFQAPSRLSALVMAGLVAALFALPLLGQDFLLVLGSEILILTLFAASLHFIMSGGGMVSFGQAAYFGMGAYAAALVTAYFGFEIWGALFVAPLVAGVAGLVFGWFCVRLSGVYLAMLSLAFAQIAWSVAMQWTEVTGGDDGLVGIWPPDWASEPAGFYYLSLVLVTLSIAALRHALFTPFGHALRAARDSPLRAEAIGINVQRQQWFAFALAGLFAGIAGGLYVFSKGSVFPDEIAIPRSIDALIMVLLGGVETLSGPLIGALAFVGLEDQLSRLAFWRLILGSVIVGICILMPQGIAGTLGELRERLVAARAAAPPAGESRP